MILALLTTFALAKSPDHIDFITRKGKDFIVIDWGSRTVILPIDEKNMKANDVNNIVKDACEKIRDIKEYCKDY